VNVTRIGYQEQGFELFKGFFSDLEIQEIREFVLESHGQWMIQNQQALDKGAVNSAYLTSSKYCPSDAKRLSMFRFIAMDKIVDLASDLNKGHPYFMNTQLFFNPKNKDRKPYWHRDIQYSGLPEEQQKELIFKDSVVHFRVPLSDDPGLEFVSGSHRRWDTGEERSVRLEQNGRHSHESLPYSVRVPHNPGDLLVFSAHVLHKGVYEGNRLSFDIVFASFKESTTGVKTNGHFPDGEMKSEIKNGQVFDLK
jgi:ectoine hydroxylase-related dioxygenase (phytanoyl-CoA dioxygenase family)